MGLLVATLASSGNPSNGVLHIRNAILLVLVVDCLILIVIVVFDVDIAMDERLQHVDEAEGWDKWEDDANPIA